MGFLNSILLLAGLVCAICVPLFIGHGLSESSPGWILTGIAFGGLSAAILAGTLRLLRRAGGRPDGRGAAH